jgi:hypothetical protein|tara:strand:- start:466 stop:2256 length:1791 start_codon:yes stop_codon:yes gene_type:complete
MSKKLEAIDYTSRDFASIRKDLENFVKRYYPNTYKDFNQASFGSLMLDTVSYIGDILSFYVDYQANESFLDTAIEYNNVVRLVRQMGLKLNPNPSSYGILTFYIKIPASTTTQGPDTNYVPILKAGSEFTADTGGFYTLLDDVDFQKEQNQIVVSDAGSTGGPTHFVIRAQGRAVSGRLGRDRVSLGNFERFRRIPLSIAKINNIVSVYDVEGHRYYEVDHLTQNVIYKAVRNTTATRASVPNILKPFPVPRRFTVEFENGKTFLQFGYGSDSELSTSSVVDPGNLMLDMLGRDYITDTGFDPTKLLNTDKFGIAPANTDLVISFRYNTTLDVNASVNSITEVSRPIVIFQEENLLTGPKRSAVVESVEVVNEEQFVGSIALPNSDEIKQRAFSYFATQNRAVTAEDYKAICYGMPAKFGRIKRVTIVRDFNAYKRNLNLYVVSENESGKLTVPNATLKNNIKNWISQYKMINDTIDILDAKIVNFGIEYEAAIDMSANQYNVINLAARALAKKFSHSYDIGEPIMISEIYKTLNKVEGLLDVITVKIVEKSGASYSGTSYDFAANTSADNLRILAEENVVFEMKFPNTDIRGSIK